MLIDIILVVVLILAAIRGYRRGLVVGLFSFVAIIVGLAAAIKLSTVVASYIGESVKVSDQWLPVISFAVVFIVVVLLIRWGANLIQKTVDITMLGWVNRLGGVLLYVLLSIIVFSVLLFYSVELKLLQSATIDHSSTYAYIHPWGPKAINAFGAIIPIFRDMFAQLSAFFEKVAARL